MAFQHEMAELEVRFAEHATKVNSFDDVETSRHQLFKEGISRRKVNKMLVPIDFSSASLGVVRYAAALAELFGASVCLLLVVPCSSFRQNLRGLGLNHSHDEAAIMGARLLIKLTRAGVAPHLRGGSLLRVGDPVQEIIAAAKVLDMDWILLAIHDDSELKRLISLGVAEQVARKQPCLILTVRPELLQSELTLRPALASKKILVLVNLSESSRLAVEWAAALAEKIRAKVIIRYAPGLLAENSIVNTTLKLPQVKKSKSIEFQLAEWAHLGTFGSIEVDLLPEHEKPDAHVVGRMLRRAESDLIVIGSPRYSWWHNLMHSHATEQLRRVAPCPVLSVPQKDLDYYADEITA